MKKNIVLFFILLLGIYPVLSSAESVNIVSNPSFESGTSGWDYFTDGAGLFLNDASGYETPHAGHMTISRAGSNVQVYQNDLTLKPNTIYQLDFKAYSNSGHDLTVSLLKHVSPYNSYGLSNKVINLGTSWGSYSIRFTTSGFSGIVNNGRLKFNLAPYDAAGDQFFLDNVTLTSASTTKPTITAHPSSKTVAVGQTATFSVVATGAAPLHYQWQKNDVDISGATSSTYTTPVTQLSNSGSNFRVLVSNSAGSATSNRATLTVTSSSNRQLVVLDETYYHTTNVYTFTLSRTATNGQTTSNSGKAFMKFNFDASFPTGSLKSPIDYSTGTLYQRIEVITKPSGRPVTYQICLFQDRIVKAKHTCSSGAKLSFSSTGTYYASQPVTSMYQYWVINWGRQLLVAMTVLKDNNANPIDDRYGFAGTWSGSPNFGLYYPMKVHYQAIIVPAGGGAPDWS